MPPRPFGAPLALHARVLARRILRGKTYIIARRCLQSEYGLRPSADVARAFRYALGVAVERTGFLVHGYVVMSTHFHLICTDPDGRLSDFMHLLDLYLAKSLNVALDRTGPFFHPGSYSAVALEDPATFLAQLAYLIVNPVQACAVRLPAQWPGLVTLPDQLAREEAITELRPDFYFRGDDQEGRLETSDDDHRPRPAGRTTLPGAVSFCLTKPPMFDDISDDEYRRLVQAAVDQRLAAVHAEHARFRRKYQGAAKVLAQDPRQRARGPALFGLNPRFACGDPDRREEVAAELVEFWTQYAVALRAYRDGDHDVVFPRGTYRMRVFFGVNALC